MQIPENSLDYWKLYLQTVTAERRRPIGTPSAQPKNTMYGAKPLQRTFGGLPPPPSQASVEYPKWYANLMSPIASQPYQDPFPEQVIMPPQAQIYNYGNNWSRKLFEYFRSLNKR